MRNPLTRRTTNLPNRWPAPTNPFATLQTEMERMFDTFGRDVATGIAYPSVDVEERAEDVHVTAELPGLTKDDIQLEVAPTGDALSIRGEKRQEEKKSDKGYHSVERAYGSFQREIPLPTRVDANRVNATLNDGVLTVDLAKADGENAARRIDVK
jgi:HSP20 family protein